MCRVATDVNNSELFAPTIVTIKVGNQDFQIPRPLICSHSVYFEKAFKGRFQEGKNGVVTLSDDADPEEFGVFVGWLYTQRIGMQIDTKMSNTDTFDPDNAESASLSTKTDVYEQDFEEINGNRVPVAENPVDPTTWNWARLFKLYIFGDAYDSRGFRNCVMEVIQIKAFQERPKFYIYPSPSQLCIAFNGLPLSSRLYQSLLDMLTYLLVPYGTESDYENLPSAVIVASWMMLKHKVGQAPKDDAGMTKLNTPRCLESLIKGVCRYHEHVTEEERRLCGLRWEIIRREHDME